MKALDFISDALQCVELKADFMDDETYVVEEKATSIRLNSSQFIRLILPPVDMRSLRSDVMTFLVQVGFPAVTRDDVLLVVSELASNAAEHCSSESIQVDIRQTRCALVVAVENNAPFKGPMASITEMPSSASTRGRGLPIAAALANRLLIHSSLKHTKVRAEFDLVA